MTPRPIAGFHPRLSVPGVADQHRRRFSAANRNHSAAGGRRATKDAGRKAARFEVFVKESRFQFRYGFLAGEDHGAASETGAGDLGAGDPLAAEGDVDEGVDLLGAATVGAGLIDELGPLRAWEIFAGEVLDALGEGGVGDVDREGLRILTRDGGEAGESQGSRAVPDLLRLFQRDDCFGGRAARMESCGPWLWAAGSLGRSGDPAAIEPLAQIVASSQTTDMIYEGGLALARLGDGRGIRPFLQLIADPDWEYSTRTIVFKLRRMLEEAPSRIPASELEGLAPQVLTGQSQEQVADVVRCPRSAGLSLGGRAFRGVHRLDVPYPATERLVADDLDQLLELDAQLPAGPEQPSLLLRRGDQSFGQSGTEDPVLLLKVGNLPRQVLAGCGRQEGEQRVQNAAHRDRVA